MIKTPYEIVSPQELVAMGRVRATGSLQRNVECSKEVKDAAENGLRAYQLWQNGPLNEETQKQFEDAVADWRRVTT